MTVSGPPAFCHLPSSVCQNICWRSACCGPDGAGARDVERRKAHLLPLHLKQHRPCAQPSAQSPPRSGLRVSHDPGGRPRFHRQLSQNTASLLAQACTPQSQPLSSVPRCFFFCCWFFFSLKATTFLRLPKKINRASARNTGETVGLLQWDELMRRSRKNVCVSKRRGNCDSQNVR